MQHVLDMNMKYFKLAVFLWNAATNAVDLMLEKLRPFLDTDGKENCCFVKLIKTSNYDDDCSAWPSVILFALATLAERFGDQNLGDIYSESSFHLRKQTASVALHNK